MGLFNKKQPEAVSVPEVEEQTEVLTTNKKQRQQAVAQPKPQQQPEIAEEAEQTINLQDVYGVGMTEIIILLRQIHSELQELNKVAKQ